MRLVCTKQLYCSTSITAFYKEIIRGYAFANVMNKYVFLRIVIKSYIIFFIVYCKFPMVDIKCGNFIFCKEGWVFPSSKSTCRCWLLPIKASHLLKTLLSYNKYVLPFCDNNNSSNRWLRNDKENILFLILWRYNIKAYNRFKICVLD